MSEAALAAQQRRIEELTAENTSLKSEAKSRRIEAKKLRVDLEAAQGQLKTITTERDDLKGKASAGPQELQTKIDELEGKLRSRDHRDAFSAVKDFTVKDSEGKESKYTLNKGVSVEDLWTALGYKAEGETPDSAKVSGLLGGAVVSKPYLFAPAGETPTTEAGASTTAIKTGAGRPGPGASRSVTNASDRVSATSQIDAAYGDRRPGRIA